ncbi:MAG: hypothetical protein AMS20_17700 [Gemmatimonas sp. SG8_28]|nr:MAG: hypothetical protein AMS20_17700 [Gemmatimonas sp. SG8_28]
MTTPQSDPSRDHKEERAILQLSRLERLSDVVYALVILRIFLFVPRPGDDDWHWTAIGPFVLDNWMTFAAVLVAVAITIIYWLQSNVLLGHLVRTDGRHTSLMIAQLFFLFFFLYAIGLGINLGPSAGTRTFESIAAALLGISGGWAWAYAITFAFVGPGLWELSWLSYPLWVRLVKRRRQGANG